MKYLKRFNEELKPSTYHSAAQKLKKKGFIERSNRLKTHASEVSYKNNVEQFFKFGVYELTIVLDGQKHTGKFYLDISAFDTNSFEDQFEDFKETGEGSIWIPVAIIPYDKETLERFSKIYDDEELIRNGYIWVFSMSIDFNITEDSIEFKNIIVEDYDTELYGSVKFNNRKDAVQFKKLLSNVFVDKSLKYPSAYTNHQTFYDAFYTEYGENLGLNNYSGFSGENIKNCIMTNLSINDIYVD